MAELLYPAPGSGEPLVYAHLGDLHITDAKASHERDLLSMLVQLEVEGAGLLDFVYLPGDVADNGDLAHYRLVAAALRLTSGPVHMITGDHDMQPGSLANFYTLPAAAPLPSDAASIGAWEENGILGKQLGPNRNARPSPWLLS